MTLENVARQRISDAMDSEIDPEHLNAALSDAHEGHGRESWELYHRIGDVLRSSDADVPMSSNFAARMSARLAAEPAIVAPIHAARANRIRIRRLALPGALAAAAAAVAFIATPQLMVAMQGNGDNIKAVTAPVASELARAAAVDRSSRTETAMRTQDIDEYLIAHQRFSPSVYSSTQYARPAAFSSGTTNK